MSFWDNIAGLYDIAESLNDRCYREMLARAKRLVPEGAKVLDCAAGTGELSFASAEKAQSVLCTDFSEKMLDRARKKARKRGIENISFAQRNIYVLPDEDGTYDVVIAGNVLHLLEEPEKAVRELFRVTKSGGKVIVPCFTGMKGHVLIRLYKVIGFDPKYDFTSESYVKMLAKTRLGRVKAKVIKGVISCTFAVIYKD